MNASRAPTSRGFTGHAQLEAILVANHQQRISIEYTKITGKKGYPKSKEAQQMFKNWGPALQNTMTKFCKTAKKAVKDTGKTVAAFGLGAITQILENNGITPSINSTFSLLANQDWVKKNKGGVLAGKLSGYMQAAVEYKTAFGIANAGFSAALGQFGATSFATGGVGSSGAAALSAGIATATAAISSAVISHANMVAKNTTQAFKSGSNYSNSGNSGGSRSFENKEKLDGHYEKHGSEMKEALNKKNYSKKDYLNDANHVIKEG